MRIVLAGLLLAISLFGLYESAGAVTALRHPELTPGTIFRYPPWGAVHFGTAILFALMVPLQFWPAFRERHRGVHRVMGRAAAAVAFVMALSGIAFVFVLPARPHAERIFFTIYSAAFLFFLGKAVIAARRRDFPRHREWMIRMTATAFAAMTQRLIFPVFAASTPIEGRAEFWALFLTAAWAAWGTNMAFAEWSIDASRTTASSLRPSTVQRSPIAPRVGMHEPARQPAGSADALSPRRA
jgi:hypothetical protein